MIRTLILLHVLSGSVALLSMLGAFVTKKGSHLHRQFGKTYVTAMALALLLALVTSVLTKNVFLFFIGCFSAYFVFTGWRVATTRNGLMGKLDRLAIFAMFCVAAMMLAYGVLLLTQGENMGVVLVLFSWFALQPALQDFKFKGSWPIGKERIELHLVRMCTASIATVTAVFVVNVKTSPEFLAWIIPTVLIVPAMSYWAKKVRGEP